MSKMKFNSDVVSDDGSYIAIGHAYADAFPEEKMFIDNRFDKGEIPRDQLLKCFEEAFGIKDIDQYLVHKVNYLNSTYETYLFDVVGQLCNKPFLFKISLDLPPEKEPDKDLKKVTENYGGSTEYELETACGSPIVEGKFKSHMTYEDPHTVVTKLQYVTSYVGEKLDVFTKLYYSYAYEHKEKAPNSSVHIMTPLPNGGLALRKCPMNTDNYKDEIITQNYNDDFQEAYDKLNDFLGSEEPGIVLLSGDPGTGKTSMITHLTTLAKDLDRKFVLLPSEFANALSDPSFMTFALDSLKNSILVVEDAEEALKQRGSGGGTAVSNILNMTDGILGNLIQAKIICTLNRSDKIDEAVERKGRMKMKYHFGKLKADKATSLSKKLGINKVYTKDTVLTDIYNEGEKVDFVAKETKKMGF